MAPEEQVDVESGDADWVDEHLTRMRRDRPEVGRRSGRDHRGEIVVEIVVEIVAEYHEACVREDEVAVEGSRAVDGIVRREKGGLVRMLVESLAPV